MNVGVLVFSRPASFLAARTGFDERRLAALWPNLDPGTIRPHLAALELLAAGDEHGDPIAKLDQTARFHWLVSPSSTIIQPSEVHTGISTDPAAELDKLFRQLIEL
jgi:hypothetical protein